jgi:hypothetical protein
LNGTLGNRIDFNSQGAAAPAVTTRSAGTKLVLCPSLSGTTLDHAMGVESQGLWYSVPDTSYGFKWYAGSGLPAASLSGSGTLILNTSTGTLSTPTIMLAGTNLATTLSGKQATLGAGTGAGQNVLDVGTNKIKGLTAGTNMSLTSTDDVITINGPNLTSYATKADSVDESERCRGRTGSNLLERHNGK